jgi:hypothetical protein
MQARRMVRGGISIFGTTNGGEAEAAEAMHKRILNGQIIESDLTRPTDALAYANQAYVQAELATARTTADSAMRDAVTPGQEASLLLH